MSFQSLIGRYGCRMARTVETMMMHPSSTALPKVYQNSPALKTVKFSVFVLMKNTCFGKAQIRSIPAKNGPHMRCDIVGFFQHYGNSIVGDTI